MYWIVPTRVPAVVSGLIGLALMVFAADSSGADPTPGAASIGFASPKSISFAPAFVSMMLPGFRSRRTIPAR